MVKGNSVLSMFIGGLVLYKTNEFNVDNAPDHGKFKRYPLVFFAGFLRMIPKKSNPAGVYRQDCSRSK